MGIQWDLFSLCTRRAAAILQAQTNYTKKAVVANTQVIISARAYFVYLALSRIFVLSTCIYRLKMQNSRCTANEGRVLCDMMRDEPMYDVGVAAQKHSLEPSRCVLVLTRELTSSVTVTTLHVVMCTPT